MPTATPIRTGGASLDRALHRAEEQAARDPVEREQLTPSEAVTYLRSLPSLWADSGPDGRQALATALFARTDVVGFERMEYELTSDAVELGLGAALPTVFEIGKEREFGRRERIHPGGYQVSGRAAGSSVRGSRRLN